MSTTYNIVTYLLSLLLFGIHYKYKGVHRNELRMTSINQNSDHWSTVLWILGFGDHSDERGTTKIRHFFVFAATMSFNSLDSKHVKYYKIPSKTIIQQLPWLILEGGTRYVLTYILHTWYFCNDFPLGHQGYNDDAMDVGTTMMWICEGLSRGRTSTNSW